MVRRPDFISWRDSLMSRNTCDGRLPRTLPAAICLVSIVFVTLSSEMNDPRARLAHLVVGMVVDSAVPRLVHFCASLRMPRRWSLCLEGLYRKRRSAPLVRLCSARLPAIVPLVCSGSLCFPLRPPGCSPAEALFESAYDTRARSCPRCVWLCASWSVGTSRRRHVSN